MAALEQQQKVDHLYFAQIRSALHNINDHVAHFTDKFKVITQEQAEHTQMGLQIPRETHQTRDTTDDKHTTTKTDKLSTTCQNKTTDKTAETEEHDQDYIICELPG